MEDTRNPSGSAGGVRGRHERILTILGRERRVEVSDLAREFHVTEETIRRDLRSLEDAGKLTRAHGGAILTESLVDDISHLTGADAPDLLVARHALRHVPARGSLFLDAGVACQSLASLLPDSPELTVVTAGVPVALTASRGERLAVYNIGGAVTGDDDEQSGQWAREALATLSIDTAFVAPARIDPDGRLIAATPRSAAIKRAALDAARTRVALLHEGADAEGIAAYGSIAELDAVLSDHDVPPQVSALAAEADVPVVVAARHGSHESMPAAQSRRHLSQLHEREDVR